ncbi:MAG TPA: hypothetical protein VHO24_20950 [Opitutaceae bacterium]|nr:hypothetical protein [Opitutaceae bacterium]
MYPDGQLNELAVHKLMLRQRISLRRRLCVVAARRVSQPLIKVDHAVAQWRRISPFAKMAAVPAVLLLKRTLFRRAKIIGPLLRWGPLAFKVFRGVTAAR